MVLPMYLLFTPEDLIRYLYNETSIEKTAAIEAALREDWTLREKLEVLKASTQRLDTILESPRMEVLQRVMNYARETEVNSVP
jgi:hypothetical protein